MGNAIGYRPEIDGLRTVAVLPVIFYHAGFAVVSGGFVGVDVFFVISGYLITSILAGELDQNRFSIVRFYERRARRILPALFAVVACSIPVAWIQLDPVRFVDFSESIIATMLFASNILFWSESGYFDFAAENKPLLHTWSLAVEEQFYIIFPILLLLLWRLGQRTTLTAILLVSILSLALCVWGAQNASVANFYLLPFRMWELLAGSVCALITMRSTYARSSDVLAYLGIILLVSSILLISPEMRFPGVLTVAPVLGTALIILYGHQGTVVAKVLSVKPMVWVGLISYSLYLWHQPIFALARLRLDQRATPQIMLALVVLTFVLAALTWYLVEQPFRRRRQDTGKYFIERSSVFTLSGMIMFGFMSFGLIIIFFDGIPMRFPPGYGPIISAFEDHPSDKCKFARTDRMPLHPVDDCLHLVQGDRFPSVMILGDSHAWAVSEEFAAGLGKAGISSYVATHEACIPVTGIYEIESDLGPVDRCAQFIEQALDWAEGTGIQQLVLVGRFSSIVLASSFDNGEGGIEKDAGPARLRDAIMNAEQSAGVSREARLGRIREAIPKRLAEMSLRFDLVIVNPIPPAGWHVPGAALRELLTSGSVPDLSTSYDVIRARLEPARQLLSQIFEQVHGIVDIVPVEDIFCSEKTGRCSTMSEGVPLYYDDDHLTNTGARLLVPRVVSAVLSQRGEALVPKRLQTIPHMGGMGASQ